MLQLNKVHHLAVICSNYEKSKHFYTQVLGLEVIRETYRATRQSYKLDLALQGNYVLELFSFPNPPQRATQPEATGLRHLAFEIDSVEDGIRRLLEKGINMEPMRVDEITQKPFTFFTDPDGLPIELYEK